VAERAETLIFIVDDDDAVRDSLRLLLESYGMSVADFGSTADFVEAYRQHPRACLILDLHLPVISGLDFLGSQAKGDLEIPVILITGRGDQATRERALELGAAAYLEKPVDDRELLSVIDRVLAA
jgi:two-component system response regulator FixJ